MGCVGVSIIPRGVHVCVRVCVRTCVYVCGGCGVTITSLSERFIEDQEEESTMV